MTQKKQTHLKTTHIILLVALLLGGIISKAVQYLWTDTTIVLKDQSLSVLVAKNRYQLQKGLGGRETLEPYDGMLFVFGSQGARPGIVMRDMTIPIDIVWLHKGVVVDIAKQVLPEPGKTEEQLSVYYPRTQANIVLELPAGWADAHGLVIGDTLTVLEE